MKQDIYQLENLLTEKTEFSALDWLMSIDRLDSDDYQQWLKGEKNHLDECLLGSKKKIREKLQTLEKAAKAFQLKTNTRQYRWEGGQKPVDLSLSLDNAFAELLGRHYQRDDDAAQMDLFFDNGSLVQENLVAEALAIFDLEQAKQGVEQLYSDDPTNAKLSRFEYLLSWQQKLEAVEKSDDWNSLKPIFVEFYDRAEQFAEESLGVLYGQFSVRMWSKVSAIKGDWKEQSAKSRSFYVSALYLAKDYSGLVKYIRKTGFDDLTLDAQLHVIRAEFIEEDFGAGWSHFLKIHWDQHVDLEELIEMLAIGMIEVTWENYCQLQDRVEESSDVEMADAWFPFYLVIKEPWMAQHIEDNWQEAGDNECLLGLLALVTHWRVLKGQHVDISDEGEIQFRKQLQSVSPALLEIYKR